MNSELDVPKIQLFVILGAVSGRDAVLFAWSVWTNKLWGRRTLCKQRSFLGEILQIDIGDQWNATSSSFGKNVFTYNEIPECWLSKKESFETSLAIILLTQVFFRVITNFAKHRWPSVYFAKHEAFLQWLITCLPAFKLNLFEYFHFN